MQHDQAYNDLIEYMGVNGQFNLALPDLIPEWDSFKDIVEKCCPEMGYEFLDSLLPVVNPYLSSMVQDLYFLPKEELKTQVEDQDFPHHLPIKVCLLGRAFAGKRTSARKLVETYGDGIKIFKMADLVKEAIDYVAPKKEEVVDAKKAAPAKGKGAAKKEDEAPAD